MQSDSWHDHCIKLSIGKFLLLCMKRFALQKAFTNQTLKSMKSLIATVVLLVIGTAAYLNFDQLKEIYNDQVGQTASHESGENHDGKSEGHNHAEGSGHSEGGAEHEGGHGGGEEGSGEHHAVHDITATSPMSKDVTLTQQYVGMVHSRRHIDVCALEGGYLEEIKIKEGQEVKEGDPMFRIKPTLYEARLAADVAEARLAEVEYNNTKKLVEKQIVSDQELKMAQAKLSKAIAKVELAQAELNFALIKAPFDGIIDRFYEQQGSLIDEGAKLTTLSDNSVMWVYFNVPETRYIQYHEAITSGEPQSELIIELKLANGELFKSKGVIGALESEFNPETGNISFRADFPNAERLLRHGQTGTILMRQIEKDAIVIPQRATFENLAKKYAYVIDKDNIVRQREIVIKNEQDDIYILESGLEAGEKIVLEGIRQVRDGDKIEFEHKDPEAVLANLKHHAE